MAAPAFGLNRWDMRSPEAFAESVQRGEELGFGYAFIPSSPLLVREHQARAASGKSTRTGFRPDLSSRLLSEKIDNGKIDG